ncbi:branched-chain amino acid ABC transporter permease [Terrilactibacillus laevilacticus]|uniref:Branched-chain amino acid ABC transporter permease n=1 Tax=Terrilactibacillus laevilacticus TaxID=1380157 RepID=A0ABW5PMI9_9BACI|nr:branched-chain amino acid ABC transporter permease [Terrilactibacillus laevilacticus]
MTKTRLFYTAITILCIVCSIASLYIQNLYLLRVFILAAITAILALSVNILVGYTGQISLGHAGFFGIGAYMVGILNVNYHLSFWLCMVIAVLFSGLMGLILGLPTTKLKGHFLGIATLGFGVIVNGVLNNWMQVTGGPQGIRDIQSPTLFSIPLEYGNYFLGFIVACLSLLVLVIYLLIKSPVGRAWSCLKQDEITAYVTGIHVYRYKLLAFTLSGGIAGFAGALFAGYMTFISPDTFDLNQSISIITTVILGGSGTIAGPLLGTALLSFLNEWLRNFDELRLVIYGVILVAVIVFIPEGIYPFFKNKIISLFSRRKRVNQLKTSIDPHAGKDAVNE